MGDWEERSRSDGDANRVRISRLEQDMRDVKRQLEGYGALQEQVRYLSNEVKDLNTGFEALKRALYTAALTVAGSALLLSASVVMALQ